MLARDRYQAAHQNYDDYDEYEDDEGDEEEEEDQQEDEKPTKEVLEYLKLREKLKEKFRQEFKKENAAAIGPTHSVSKNGTTTDAKFGSFFGPSQRVIAPRVIEESRSIRETQHIVSRTPSSTSNGKNVSLNSQVKSHPNGKPHKVVNELKRKVQTLKETRDYSFLLSDDTDLPAHKEDPAPKIVSAPISDARSGRSLPPPPPKPKMAVNKPKPVKQVPLCHLSKTCISRDQHVQKKAEYQKGAPPSRPKSSSSEPRKLLEGKGGGKQSQPLVAKASSQAAAQGRIAKKPVLSGKKPSNMERAPLSTKMHSAVPNNQSQQRREIQDVPKGKLLPKQTISSSSKPQMPKSSKQSKQCSTHEDRPKQKPFKRLPRNPFDDDDDDIDDPMSFLRNKLLSRYNSSKYQLDDDDDSDMEANFDDIMEEELQSSQIAQREDEEQLRLIEEEERRERMRKEAKRRKLKHR